MISVNYLFKYNLYMQSGFGRLPSYLASYISQKRHLASQLHAKTTTVPSSHVFCVTFTRDFCIRLFTKIINDAIPISAYNEQLTFAIYKRHGLALHLHQHRKRKIRTPQHEAKRQLANVWSFVCSRVSKLIIHNTNNTQYNEIMSNCM